jgi:CHAT domain-containing protein
MKRLVACLLLCWCCTAPAQDAQPLRLLSAAESQALRRTLAQPAPAEGAKAEVLRQHFIDKELAATRLADNAARKAVVQQALERLPQDARWPNQLASMLQAEGRYKEAMPLYERAKALTRGAADKLFFESNIAHLLALMADPDAAPRVAAARDQTQALLEAPDTPPAQQLVARRTLTSLAATQFMLLQRRGRAAEALGASADSHQQAQAVLKAAQEQPGTAPAMLRAVATDLALAQRRHAGALRELERDAEAEALLQEHLRTINAHAVAADFAAGAHHALAALRMSQRNWPEAEAQLRLSLRVADQLGYPPAQGARLDKIGDLAVVLWAQGRSVQAQAVLDTLDASIAGDKAAQQRARLPFARGLVHLANGRFDAAAPWLAEAAQGRQRRFGEGHYFTAQAKGLHGLALWRGVSPAPREQGADLLRQAVLDLRAPRNSDFDNDRSTRRAVRELILAAYVDAMTTRGGLPALWALGVADGLRGGVTGQALADAALRASASDPELAALARHEQDARREWQAAEQLLQAAGEGGEGAAAQAQLRARVSELTLLRQQLQQRLRERFPGYEQIQRPPLPDPAAVAERLGRHEQLLMLMPTEHALLAWTVSAGDLPQFMRIDVDAATLRALVKRMLAGVVLEPGARAPSFDAEAAHELYRRVMAPLAPRLSAPELIVAASGVLAPLPLNALLAAAPARGVPPAWLVQRHAITQVPSVAAWLSLRQAPRGRPAPEALMGWGDPLFAQPATRAGTRAATGLRYADIPPLPETRDELLAIARALKADPARDLLLGAQATRDSVLKASADGQLAKKRVVLFATHGLVAGDLPGLRGPALAMAAPSSGGAFEGGLLTLDDVLGLKLNADWVVLSACNTAAGDGRAEEMLSGLARGFFYAGSRSVLVTQWAVETESAKRLTTAVFEHQARHATASKAESLRQAMLQVMAQPAYAHPTFWAPYILVGDSAR